MKKFLTIIAAVILSAGFGWAQSLEEATDLYNSGATMLNSGNADSALGLFEQALSMGETLGEEAAELIGNCKNIIPKVILSKAKEFAAENDFENAVATTNKAIEKAESFDQFETLSEASALLTQLVLQDAGVKLNAKDFAGAAAGYRKATELDPDNAIAWLRLGMALGASSDIENAVAAYKKAAELGQDNAANKQLGNLYLIEAVKCQKQKNFAGMLENAEISASYNESANAYKLIGTAAAGLNQNDKAIEGFEKYLAIQPNAKDKNQIYYQLATVYQNSGNNSQACTYFKMIMSDPKFGEYATHVVKNVLKCE